VLIESLLQRIKAMGIIVKTLFMDREFFSLSTISTLHKLNTHYIIAATANKKINGIGLRPQSGQQVKLCFTMREIYGKNRKKKTYKGIQDLHNSGA
jgi:hypothetical protein